MRVTVRDIDVAIELGNNGITMEIRDNADDFVGKLRLGRATVEWCQGKVPIGNGKMVRMWDFTEQQYQSLICLCIGINQLLPGIKLRVPFNRKTKRTPLDRTRNFSSFAGILGHAHVQKGNSAGILCK